MNFEGDAFISYSQLDNLALKDGGKGWIENLHRALQMRVGQLLGKQAIIWPDPKVSSGTADDSGCERLRSVAALVSVVSPAYVKSESARRELREFWNAAEAQGGIRFGDKARIFKVLKSPVPLEKQALELRPLLGYEFFKFDPETGRVRELDEIFGSQALTDFWRRLDDLAHDMGEVLELLEDPQPTSGMTADEEKSAVFLAETTPDLWEQRDAIKRDLLQHGYTVLPVRTLPLAASDLRQVLREDLARCRMSIHLVGKDYGVVPEGAAESLLEIQNELAIERGEQGEFSSLLWIPTGLRVEDERQRNVIDRIRMNPRIQNGGDLLETLLEDLRTVVHERLKHAQEPARPEIGSRTRLYLIHDQRDIDVITPWRDFMSEQGLEVVSPLFERDEAERREFHEEHLRTCDGALIVYGAGSERWLRQKLKELQKSPGYGRVDPMPVVAIILVPPKTAEKEHFRIQQGTVIPQWYGLSPDALRLFASQCHQHHADSQVGSSESEEDPLMPPTRAKSLAPVTGTKLGPYEIVAPLGTGGMGEVYRARDPRLDRDVALKILPEGLLGDEIARRQFRREAMALARLSHPHIAVIYDVGQEAGVDYLVMECVQGESLAEKLKSGPLEEQEVVSLGAQVAEALEEAHQQGVVHRDLKPANIMVTTKQQVKVLDFGLAKLLISTASFTETQSPAGTLPYMAPEQLNGESADARTDIYGLGTVLFEMAAGRQVIQERLMIRLIDAILHQPPVRLREINPRLSPELERIVAKTLEKNRDLRYQSAAELRADLARLIRAGV